MTPKQKHRFYLKKIAQWVAFRVAKGSFIECGVKYGTSAIIMAQELQCNGYLFDTWNRRESITNKDGNKERILRISQKRLKNNVKKKCEEALIDKEVRNLCKLIEGDACKTLPIFLKNNCLSFKMAHFDTDLYLSTKIPLFEIYPFLEKEGIIFVHDYGSLKYKGVKLAVDEFVRKEKVFLYIYKDIEACLLTKKLIDFQSNFILV